MAVLLSDKKRVRKAPACTDEIASVSLDKLIHSQLSDIAVHIPFNVINIMIR